MRLHRRLLKQWLRVLLMVVVVTAASYRVNGAPPSGIIDRGRQEERWLADESFYDLEYVEEQPQADGHEPVTSDLCPPVPKILPLGGCDVPACSSDRECAGRQLKCCYNGCAYMCLPEVKPPAYFDWIKEPVRRFQFGQSWLVPGPNSQLDVELCSTTPVDDDSDPLICPHGYECSIDDEGRPAEGIPNRGHCVKVSVEAASESILLGTNLKDYMSTNSTGGVEDRASLHACRLDEQQIVLSGHTFSLRGQNCTCFETKITCEERSNSSQHVTTTGEEPS